jgi:uncharacterized repeat protein (TIGR01451 family)
MYSLLHFFAVLSLAVTLVHPAAAQEKAPTLDLSKSAYDEEVSVGDEAIFFIAVTNVGRAAATDVVVEDLLPAGLRFAAAHTTRGRYDAATGRWSLDTLAAGQSESLELVTVLGTEASVQNCASAWTSGADAPVTDCAIVRPKREKMVPLAARVPPDSR